MNELICLLDQDCEIPNESAIFEWDFVSSERALFEPSPTNSTRAKVSEIL